MRTLRRTALRACLLALLFASVVSLAGSYAAAGPGVASRGGADASVANHPPHELTVVTTQGFMASGERAELVVFDADGQVVYYDDTYATYFDVDPVPGERYTVEYVAASHHDGPTCRIHDVCTTNVVERVNLSTGETSRVYSEVTPGVPSTRWHDADRVNDTHLLVADIYRDTVFAANGTDGTREWEWKATEAYTFDQGGQPTDWTHVNDVELLPDGRVLLSMRNMDQVLFLEPCDREATLAAARDRNPAAPDTDGRVRTAEGTCEGYAVDESWSLGTDDDHEVLYEQHNPDYLTVDRGGPAVLVSDSENNRVVEYRREAGEWVRSWEWRDARLQWPRDADRLPNDNTLVVDSHGDRVVEVAPNGRTVWSVDVSMAYDAERLGTGDESATGRSVAAMRAAGDVPDVGPVSTPPTDAAVLRLKSLTPNLVVNAALYAAPPWVGFVELLVAGGGVLAALFWAGAELRWSTWSLCGGVRRLADRASGRGPRG